MKVQLFLGALALGMAAIASPPPVHAADSAFLKEIDDLPLAPGLTELPGGTLFDAPQGRIVEATAKGDLLEVQARQFYDESLPQLGWTQTGSSTYQRDKEVLIIQYSDGMPMTVHFSLAPAASGDKGQDKDKDKDKSQDGDKSAGQDQNPSQDEGAKE